MILETLKQDKMNAMKEKNIVLRDLIWIVLTNIQVKEKEKSWTILTDQDIIKIIEKEIKQINDTLQYLKDENKINEEKSKIQYLEKFIPEEMSEDEVKNILIELIKQNNIDKNRIWDIMKIAKENNLPLWVVNKVLRSI